MTRRCFAAVLAVVVLTLAEAGCNKSGGLREVEGNITMDKAPVAEGEIIFVPEDKNFRAEGGKIKDGKYKMGVRDGKHRVEIRATRLVPGKLGPMGEPAIEDYIPPPYNEETTLSAEVGDGRTTFDFPLTSKKE